jgi:hypothetical protein
MSEIIHKEHLVFPILVNANGVLFVVMLFLGPAMQEHDDHNYNSRNNAMPMA